MPPSYLRHPHLHGDTLVFVAEDDVWTAPLAGGRAYRLSSHDVPAARPRLSADGTQVAWTSRRDGDPEVYVSDLDGGGARRLTYWGDLRTQVLLWTPAGDVLVASTAGQPTHRRQWAYTIPGTGGTPQQVRRLGPTADAALDHATGAAVVLNGAMSREMAWWKRYRGGAGGRLWWDADGSGEFVQIATDLGGQLGSPLLVGDRIAFLSDHEGWGNLYSLDRTGAGLRRHTDHGAPGGDAPAFYVRHPSTDGERVVYESAGQLWILDSLAPDATPRRLEVQLSGPRTDRAPRRVSPSRWLTSARPDRTGRTSIAVVRGTVHRLTHRDGPARVLFAQPGARARLARPLGADRAIWVDDAEGEESISIAPLDPSVPDAPALRRVGWGELGRVLELAVAPDARSAALTTHDGRLLVLDLADAENPALRELTRSAVGDITGVAYSPDSAWIAFCEPFHAGLTSVVLARLADDEQVRVTEPRFTDADPVFTSDGRYLAFLSRRSFDPIYDEHSFDLTFPASWRPFLVPLAARTPSPFGASPDGRPVTTAEEGPHDPPAERDTMADAAKEAVKDAEKDAAKDAEKDAAKDDKGKDEAPPKVVVDVEGISARVVPIPVDEARYSGMRAAKDCLLWIRTPISGVLGDGRAESDDKSNESSLERYDLVRRRLDVIVDPVSGYAVSGDGTRLVVRDGDKLRVLRTDRSGSGAPSDNSDGGSDEFEIDTHRIVVTIDPAAEWRQMFEETGRLMRDHFWAADMAEVDWAGELDRYRPLVDAVGSHDDLTDVLWELHGELGTSHAYVGARSFGDSSGRPGLLGADLEPAPDGGWRVTRVLPPETSAPAARSPLSSPGADVRAGDVILEVGGQPVDPALGPAPLLVARGGDLVELTVRTGPDRDGAGEVRRVVVRPLTHDMPLRYQDWVAGRRAFVVERSAGRLGYLHVPDMMAGGWAQLHRDLSRETGHDGLILDVRSNGGGHTSQLVVEKLARKVIGWEMGRHREPETYPMDAPRGPIVALADEYSGSDGDIVTQAIKRLGIAPVVGVRTWGGVIGIDSRYSLVDSTGVTQPRYAFHFDDVEWGVENHGVDPDVEVVIAPQDWAADRDPQLERAVDMALEALEQQPAAVPPDPATRPSRLRPELPPRT